MKIDEIKRRKLNLTNWLRHNLPNKNHNLGNRFRVGLGIHFPIDRDEIKER